MAKGKNLNPADAFRKAQRAKEIKKNKETRAKARETATLKKDTNGLETEIHELEDIGEEKLSSTQKERLKELRADVARIRKTKQDYVKAHPEQSHLVRGLEARSRRAEDVSVQSNGNPSSAVRAIFGKNGLPVHPERSVYYDPVLNPYGMPPPGMPYAERPLLPHEIEEDHRRSQGISRDNNPDVDSVMDSGESDSEDDEAASDDDDIVLPAGPPPDESQAKQADSDDSDDSDDDIPMPPGPPPPKTAPPLPEDPPPPTALSPPAAPYGVAFPPFPPNAPPYAQTTSYVPPLPGFPSGMYAGYSVPPVQMTPFYPQQMPTSGRGPKPPQDRQFAEAVRAVQDPLSNLPHVTYQAHQAQRHQLPPTPLTTVPGPQALLQHGLPPKPGGVKQASASAIIFAEPELRDLKKEATAFVPTSMRRAAKKGTNTNAAPGLRIDAAPNDAGDDQSQSSAEPRKDLMSVLGSQLAVTNKPPTATNNKGGQGKDDYDKFLAEVGSFL